MKTFKEFIAERYYEPDEPLPSGKTPYGKATSSYYRQKGEYYKQPESERTLKHAQRMANQITRRNKEVSRGANNPDFDWKPDKSGRYSVYADGPYNLSVRDRNSDVEMRVRQKDQIAPGRKPVYDVEWYNLSGKYKHNPGEARGVVRDVAKMWKNQVAPRIPRNSVLTNFPIDNNTSERNTRSKLYSKIAGFGDRGNVGRQYANVGRNPSPRQAAKGAQRITPMSGNLNPSSASSSEIRDLNIDREHKWGTKADEPKYFERRKIAPAKPSRPSQNKAMNALKSTQPMKAPTVAKPAAIKMPAAPKIPKIKIRGGGRAALAGAALTGAGLVFNALQSKKK